jgi:riboflavin kinase/FMN adenylyltransferase
VEKRIETKQLGATLQPLRALDFDTLASIRLRLLSPSRYSIGVPAAHSHKLRCPKNMQMELFSMAPERDVVLTMGVFDGVHRGHRHLAQQVKRRAQELHCLSGIITLHPHPEAVLRPGNGPAYLVTLDERLALLRDLGLDLVARLPFTLELARLSALEFMGLLRQHLRLRELWVGPDFALGHRREGTVTRLAEIGQELGYQVHAVSPLVLNGQTVSSTLIRHLVRQGQVEAAARLLKRRHHVRGMVVPDGQRGRHLGSSTAKVAVADGLALPAGGVYAAYARLGSRQWPALAYVGSSLAGTERRLEVHMPDLADDLDGQSLRVEFVRRLPSDARFISAEFLTAQIEKDLPLVQVLKPLSVGTFD